MRERNSIFELMKKKTAQGHWMKLMRQGVLPFVLRLLDESHFKWAITDGFRSQSDQQKKELYGAKKKQRQDS